MGRELTVDDWDRSDVKTAQPDFAMRTGFDGREAVRAPNHPVEECSARSMSAASGITYDEVDRQLLRALEPLRSAVTGREAVLEMLHGILSFNLSQLPESSAAHSSILHSGGEATPHISRQWRLSLRSLSLDRLERSVYEGELPEDADVEVLSCLLLSFASGLAASAQYGISAASWSNSISLFVESIGFQRIRAPKRRRAKPPTVMRQGLTLIKR